MSKSFQTKIKLMKQAYAAFCPFGLIMGIWILFRPGNFWSLISPDVCGGPVAPSLYGAVVLGIGITCFLGLFHPLRYLFLFPFMIIYKSIFLLLLVPRLLLMEQSPPGGWIVAAAFLLVILVSIRVFPWNSWEEIGAGLRRS